MTKKTSVPEKQIQGKYEDFLHKVYKEMKLNDNNMLSLSPLVEEFRIQTMTPTVMQALGIYKNHGAPHGLKRDLKWTGGMPGEKLAKELLEGVREYGRTTKKGQLKKKPKKINRGGSNRVGETEERYANFLQELHKQIKLENQTVQLSKLIADYGVSTTASTVVQKIKIIKHVGVWGSNRYEWTGPEPAADLGKVLREGVNAYQAASNARIHTKKNKEKKEFQTQLKLVEVEETEIKLLEREEMEFLEREKSHNETVDLVVENSSDNGTPEETTVPVQENKDAQHFSLPTISGDTIWAVSLIWEKDGKFVNTLDVYSCQNSNEALGMAFRGQMKQHEDYIFVSELVKQVK